MSQVTESSVLVQFVTQILPDFRSQIETLGGKVYRFMPNYAYVVAMDADTRAAVAQLPYVRWIGPYEPAYRVERFLRETRKPPVAAFRRAGVPMALATDCNPGTSPCTSPLLMMNMACVDFGLTPAEALAGFTVKSLSRLFSPTIMPS